MHIKVVLTLYCNWCYAIALYPKIALVQKILMIIWVVGKMIPTAVLDAGFNLWRCVIVCEALYELYPYENKWNQMRCVQWATQLGVRAMRISKRLGTFSSIIEYWLPWVSVVYGNSAYQNSLVQILDWALRIWCDSQGSIFQVIMGIHDLI